MNQQNFFNTLRNRGITPEKAAWLICHLNDTFKTEYGINFTEEIPTQENLQQKITNLLLDCGFRCNFSGFDYLRDAIFYYVENGVKSIGITELYHMVGKFKNKSQISVERSIRYAIETTYDRYPSKISKLMGVSLEKKPSSSGFICCIANKIRSNLL